MNTDELKTMALLQCYKSSYKKRMGAIVVSRGQIVGKGFNKVHSTGHPRFDGKHAELEALNNTTAKHRKNSTVFVCRLTQDGRMAMAKPCRSCHTVMKKMGIKYVWYSTENRWIKIIL